MSGFGAPHLHLRRTDSTNDLARLLAERGAPSGTIVSAAEQTAGRGRRGRAWSAPPGAALLLSTIVRPLGRAGELLPLAAAIAVCEAVEELTADRCLIKWPNDVWLEGRKLAGILIEARVPDWAVIGIGVNVDLTAEELPADLRWPATSLGGRTSVGELRDALCAALGRWSEAGSERVLSEFRERDALHGRAVSWADASHNGTGRAAGIDEQGNLVVERDDGERLALGSGEVQLRLLPD